MAINTLLDNEPLLRFSASAGIFAVMAAWELMAPKRAPHTGKPYRWVNNLAIILLNSLVVRLLFPVAAVGAALYAETHNWGLFNLISWNEWNLQLVAIIFGLLLLDFVIWAQHLTFHFVPVLWRLHRMHHTDTDYDVTTGLRFHPIEILLSMLIKIAIVLLFGIPAIAVLLFEVLLNASSLFNHGNVRIPLNIDRWLRLFIVTPDMHRVHHSVYPKETNSNFGFNLPWWDRLFGTYTSQPRDGHNSMKIGIETFRDAKDSRFDRLLLQPFINKK